MRQIAFIFIIFGLLGGQASAQHHEGLKEVGRIRTLLEQASPGKQPSVHLAEQKPVLEIDGYEVPLAETTLVRCERDGGKYHVKFFLQKGTAVTKADEPTFRRAYWAIMLRDKKACEEFVTLFGQLRAELSK